MEQKTVNPIPKDSLVRPRLQVLGRTYGPLVRLACEFHLLSCPNTIDLQTFG